MLTTALRFGKAKQHEPVPTLTAGGTHLALAEPEIRPLAEAFIIDRQDGRGGKRRARSLEEPLPTATGSGSGYVVDPILIEVNHGGDRNAKSVDEPIGTVTSKNGKGIVEPFIVDYAMRDGEGSGKEPNAGTSADEPLPTVITRDRFGVVEPAVDPFIVPQDTQASLRGLDEPIPTVRTTSRGVRLIQPYLVAHFGEREGQKPRTHDINAPLPTVTNRGAGDLVQAEIAPAGGTFGGYLVEIDGKPYAIDIKFRMLQPEELALAQGFPVDYKFTGTKEARTAQIGNAVCVKVAYHLMRQALKCIYGDAIGAAA